MEQFWQTDPEPPEIYFGIVKTGCVHSDDDEKGQDEAQSPTGKPARRRLDIARLATLDEPDDMVGPGQLVAFSAPTARPACSIIL